MKVINTRLHGMLDYASAFVLLIPWITDFYTGGTDTKVLATVGGLTILVSLCTDYEFGLLKFIPMKVHLAFDVLSALFLIGMPWLFPVNNYQFYWPVLLGIGELLVIVMSSSEPYRVRRKGYNITTP